MSDPGKKAVFLSYASQDAGAAQRICDALRGAGIEVWFDQSELRGGDVWDQLIRQQIRECALFLPIISAGTQARAEGYFRLEWRLADQRTHLMGRNRPFVVPICVDGTPDAGADVPDSFLAVQWIRVPGGDTPPAVVGHVQRLLAADSAAPGRIPAPPPSLPRLAPGSASARENSVAVLAFANLSNDADDEFFSDGISEELINVLARVPGLKVSARTSAFHFKGKSTPIAEIARQLGVAYVVEGSVRKSGDRVRITAQLIKAGDGFHAWSDAFTRDLKDIFAVQDEIAALVAKSLSLKLDLAEHPVREVNPAAYRLFLEGRTIFNRGDTREYQLAIDCYRRSLQIDPNSALTWAWLALPHTLSSGLDANSPVEGYRLGREAAARALALDPHLAKAHASMAFVDILGGWDWKQAEAHLEKAAAIAPGDVETTAMRAHLLTVCGQPERALPLAQRAMEDDPLNYIANYALGRCLFVLGRFEELEAKMEHAVQVNPAGMRMRFYLSVARLFQGKPDAAAQAAEDLPAGWVRCTALACARFAQGRVAESEAELSALKAGFSSQAAYQVAQVYAWRGETDLAFEWLEKSYETRDSGMPLMRCDPFFASVRADRRWLPLLQRMRLTDELLM